MRSGAVVMTAPALCDVDPPGQEWCSIAPEPSRATDGPLTLAGSVNDNGERVSVAEDSRVGAMTDTIRFIDQKLRTWQC